jgi:uncharacterized protein with PQ loop repeat
MAEVAAVIIGWLAAGVSTGIAVPQAAHIWRNRHEENAFVGVALGTWVLLTLNAALWLTYAILTKAYPVGFPSLINGPLGAYVVVSVWRSRRKECR